MDLLNAFTRLISQCKVVVGRLDYAGGVPSIAESSGYGESDQAQFGTPTDTGTGDVIVIVKNFRGRQGKLAAFANSTTISVFVSPTAASYTADTDTANFTFKIENDASTATDAGFYFFLVAY